MAAHELTVRPADPSEAPDVLALVRQAYRGEESRGGWTTEADLLDDERIELSEVVHKISRPDGVVLLGFEADQLLACCELVDKGDGLAYFGMFAVRPARQAAGLGRRMLAEAERYARESWQARVLEMTVIGQRGELIDWYLRRGYSATGETREFPYANIVNGIALRDDLFFTVLAKQLSA